MRKMAEDFAISRSPGVSLSGRIGPSPCEEQDIKRVGCRKKLRPIDRNDFFRQINPKEKPMRTEAPFVSFHQRPIDLKTTKKN
ncbi:uncharacterized protein OCT59_016868 [Rhizophagus irregularis]|uniref:uncharacterized protein n=1 Tax=Rhizophagus irregularis TaxID=588596 RepID=UPI001C16BD78|nr:hypothetical protein OCT59_016868 [Rhizophagus irregularis]CAB4476719.1 unnamed protein product [Rhizophagus irregularis]CAB5189054.1 unnamed protein product [Rhizophagus irregularis]